MLCSLYCWYIFSGNVFSQMHTRKPTECHLLWYFLMITKYLFNPWIHSFIARKCGICMRNFVCCNTKFERQIHIWWQQMAIWFCQAKDKIRPHEAHETETNVSIWKWKTNKLVGWWKIWCLCCLRTARNKWSEKIDQLWQHRENAATTTTKTHN